MAGKVGDGSRFKSFVKKVEAEGESAHEAAANAAIAGRKKYGSKRFAKMAAKGRARHEK